MIKIAALVLMVFSYNIALSGLPDEDPEIKRLRNDFVKAKKPVKEDLQLKKIWYCNERPASKGNTIGVIDATYFKFRYQGEFGGEEHYKNTLLPNYKGHRILHMRADSLMGYGSLGLDPIEDTKYMYFIRISSDGRLVVESTRRTNAISEPNKYVTAISAASDGEKSLSSLTYAECKTEIPVNPASVSSSISASKK